MNNTQDKLLQMFFEPERWRYAISKGYGKGIRKDQLYALTLEEGRMALYMAMKERRYRISPPHTAQIPKDKPGEFRTVYVNEPVDRLVLSIINDIYFELMPEMIHPRCKSYLKGVGCGRVVQEVSHKIQNTSGDVIGWKSDLSKYFDSVPLRYIDGIFDRIDAKCGRSVITDIVRDYYHTDVYFDENGDLQEAFQSLKQGCAVAAFLADVIIYHIDEKIAKMDGYYVRYSDDMIFVGNAQEQAMECLRSELAEMDMSLNPKKVEALTHDRWFKFLGFSIKGADISLSQGRIKTFQKEIETRTIKDRGITLKRAINAVNRYLYRGNGEFSWATQVLPVVNVKKDIDTLNAFVMDCLRAVETGKKKLGGLGGKYEGKDCFISRGIGRNVKANRAKTPKDIEGYMTLGCMQKAMQTSKAVYRTLVAQL